MIHDGAGIGRSVIHDAAGIARSMIHDAAVIGRSMITTRVGGPYNGLRAIDPWDVRFAHILGSALRRHHPCDARHGPLAGFCHRGDIIAVMARTDRHRAPIRRPSIRTTSQTPTG